jgi:hypothetical protein
MKKYLAIVGAVAFALTSSALAHDGSPALNAVKFPDSHRPVIDGLIGDWDAVDRDVYGAGPEHNSPSNGIPQDRGTVGENNLPDPASLIITHKFGWNDTDNNIYYLTSVFDDIHVTAREEPGLFFFDDGPEFYLMFAHISGDDAGATAGVARVFAYKYAVPPLQGAFEFFRPVVNLPWMKNGSKWVEIGWSFEGEEFGESTYHYEIRIHPIDSMPISDDALESEVNIGDLEAGNTVHVGIFINEADNPADEPNARIGMWSLSPTDSTVQDLFLAPDDDSIVWGEPTAVEAASWGRIKGQFIQ